MHIWPPFFCFDPFSGEMTVFPLFHTWRVVDLHPPGANQTKKTWTPSPELTAGCAGPESEFNTASVCQSLPTLVCSLASILVHLGSVWCVLCLWLSCVHLLWHHPNGSLSVVRTGLVKRQPGPMSNRMRIRPSLLKSWTMFCNLGCGSSSFQSKYVDPSFRASTTLLEYIYCARFRDVVKKSGGPDVYLTSKYPTEAWKFDRWS